MPTAYFVWQPIDSTKGIDSNSFATCFTLSKACAEDCAHGRGGSVNGHILNGRITSMEFEDFKDFKIPVHFLKEVKPSHEQLQRDSHNKRRDAAIKRARDAGVNIDDINLIAMGEGKGAPF